MTSITLPWPPAANNLFATFNNHRIRTRRYEAWITDATEAVLRQRPQKLAGPFHVRILLDRPDKRRRDLDGLAKAAMDLLVKLGVTDDDSLAQSLSLAWSDLPPAKPGAAHVSIFSAATELQAVSA